jgi:DNA-binding transcriptional LysR family regulator
LKVSIVSTGKYVLPYFLSNFLKLNPGVEISIDVTNREKVGKSLLENEVDFSLVPDLPDTQHYAYIDILPNDLFLFGNRETALLNPTFKYHEFKNELPLIFRENGSATRKAMEIYLKSQGISFLKKIELVSNEAVKQAVIAGLGYSIMPIIGLKNELKTGALIIMPRKGLPISSTWKLIWHKDKNPSPIAQAFMTYVLEHSEEIKKQYFE